MTRSVQQIVEAVKAKEFDVRLKRVRASFRFDVEQAEPFRIEVDQGRLTVREDGGPADCVIACSADDFVRIVRGEQNMLTAIMQGRVGLEGDLALVKLFHTLMPAPQREPAQEEASR